MRLLRKFALLLVVIVALRTVLALGIGWVHYENTPPYQTYVSSHPVSADFLSSQFKLPDPIHREDTWSAGSKDLDSWDKDSDFDLVHQTLKLEVDHGDDLMLRLEHKLELALEKDSWDHMGFQFSAPKIRIDPAFRVVVLVWLDDAAIAIGKGTSKEGQALFDIFLLSGPGEPEVHYLDFAQREQTFANISIPLPLHPGSVGDGTFSKSFPAWRFITGISNNLYSLPEEGLVHYFNARFHFTWVNYDTGQQMGSVSGPKHYTNTEEYSYRYKMSLAAERGRSTNPGYSTEEALTKTWNDETW